jgi:VWFA-related protein
MRQLSFLFTLPFLAGLALAQPPQSVSPTPALHTRVKLVILDVVVTDQNHKAVHGLKASDFVLLENNTSQTLKSFEEHSVTPTPATAAPQLPPGIFTNYTPVASGGPLNILLLDGLNTKLEDQARVRKALLDYLQTAKPGTRFALFTLDIHLKLVVGFTDDLQAIRQAVLDFKPIIPRMMPSEMDSLAGPGKSLQAMQSSSGRLSGNRIVSSGMNPQPLAPSNADTFLSQYRPKYSLDAINGMARYLAGIPGRKNLLWFAGGFPPVAMVPEAWFDQGPLANAMTVGQQELRDTVDMLSRSEVSVYPIFAPGLGSDSSADDNSSMLQMASQTGGRAYINSNALTDVIARSLEDGSSYYTLSYQPSDPHWDGKYRNLRIRLRQAGYNLSYRQGYFADDPDGPSRFQRKFDPGATTATYSAMHLALLRGTPQPLQVVLTARIAPAAPSPERSIAPGNVAKDGLRGPFRRYRIDALVDPRGMAFTQQPDGKWHDSLEFIAFLYDSESRLINSASMSGSVNLNKSPDETYQQSGLPLHLQISVPVKGDYFLRIGVHDIQGDRVGAIEVPVDAVKGLPAAK